MYKLFLIVVALLLTVVPTAFGKVKLPHLVSNNMILQQNSTVRLWGWAKPGARIMVSTSWSNNKTAATTDSDGKWKLTVQTPKADHKLHWMEFNDGDKVRVDSILMGEVWVCAGQSNMEMPIKGFTDCPVEGYNEAIIESPKFAEIHYCKIPSRMSMKPEDDANCKWLPIGPTTVKGASATGYYFGQTLYKAIGVPIGLIEANMGGTRVESWLTEDNLRKYTDEPLTESGIQKIKMQWLRPLVWGNATFNPIINYSIKGIIFYQGCSNVDSNNSKYAERLKLLVEQWRSQFDEGEIPFYFVQIAPYYWYDKDPNGISGALLREQQLQAADMIPNSGIVCTNDLVYPFEAKQIHPRQKKPVGHRLAMLALNRNYGMKDLICESSRFDRMEIKGDTAIINLKNTYGVVSRYQDFQGFEIAGEDRVFHPATVTYDRHIGIMVRSNDVKQPTAVRYCFRNFQLGNVKNAALLPLFPFRTDNW